jgi:hypothetical protein
MVVKSPEFRRSELDLLETFDRRNILFLLPPHELIGLKLAANYADINPLLAKLDINVSKSL